MLEKYEIKKRSKEETIPVYKAEIVDEEEAGKKIAYRLGAVVGKIIAALGFFNEIRHFFKSGKPVGGGPGRGMGRGKRRKNVKRGGPYEGNVCRGKQRRS